MFCWNHYFIVLFEASIFTWINLVESHYCKIDVFKNISRIRFVDVEKFDCFDICFIFHVKYCLCFNMKSKNQIYWNSLRTCNFVQFREIENFDRICTFWEKTTKLLVSTFAHFEKKRVYTMFSEMNDFCLNTL